MSSSSAEPSTNFGSASNCIEQHIHNTTYGNGVTSHWSNDSEFIACDAGDGERSKISHHGLDSSSTSTAFHNIGRLPVHKQLASGNVQNENNNNDELSQIYLESDSHEPDSHAPDSHALPFITRFYNRTVSSKNNLSSSLLSELCHTVKSQAVEHGQQHLRNVVVVGKSLKRSSEQMRHVLINPLKRFKSAAENVLVGVARVVLDEELMNLKGEVGDLKGNISQLEEKVGNLNMDVGALKNDNLSLEGELATVQGDMNQLEEEKKLAEDEMERVAREVSRLEGEKKSEVEAVSSIVTFGYYFVLGYLFIILLSHNLFALVTFCSAHCQTCSRGDTNCSRRVTKRSSPNSK